MFARMIEDNPGVLVYDPTSAPRQIDVYPNPSFFGRGQPHSLADLLNSIDILPMPTADESEDPEMDVEFSDGEYENKTIRYFLTPQGEFIYSFEGAPDPRTPIHSQMGRMCLAAGNMMFNAQNQLIKVNHQSFDFKPSFSSLRYLFRFLLSHSDVKLSTDPEFTIEVEEKIFDLSPSMTITYEVSMREINEFAFRESQMPLPAVPVVAETEVMVTRPLQPPTPKKRRRSDAFLVSANHANSAESAQEAHQQLNMAAGLLRPLSLFRTASDGSVAPTEGEDRSVRSHLTRRFLGFSNQGG